MKQLSFRDPTQRWTSILFLAVLSSIWHVRSEANANTRPNVLFIITDDQERSEFNVLPQGRDAQGKPRNLTPNIDRLATEGVVFLNQYVSSPVCTPSRYSVLTGAYASRSTTFAAVAQRSQNCGNLCLVASQRIAKSCGHSGPIRTVVTRASQRRRI